MAGKRDSEVTVGVPPDRVIRALPQQHAAVVAQVALELAARQAARLIVNGSTCPPPIGGSRPSSRYEATISRAASNSISRASSIVRPHVTTAGHSASCAIVQPFSSGVKTAVKVNVSLISEKYAPHRGHAAPALPLRASGTTSRALRRWAMCWSLESESGAGGHHGWGSGVDGVDDLGVVDALEVDARDAEVGVAELALDHVQGDSFAGHLDGVRVAQLVGREPAPHAAAAWSS